MNFSEPEIIIIIAVIVLLFVVMTSSKSSKKTHKDSAGRIEDSSVTINMLIKALSGFQVKMNPKLKAGYTEKSIQNQLKIHLQEKFTHVVSEYGIEGINATKIDFDIGNGAIGLEIKLAKSIFKTKELHRLVGQIEDYSAYKYDADNLIVAVFGEKEHTNDRAMLKRIRKKVEDKRGTFIYIEMASKID